MQPSVLYGFGVEENRRGFNLIIELSIIVHFESGVQSLKRGRHFSNPIIYMLVERGPQVVHYGRVLDGAVVLGLRKSFGDAGVLASHGRRAWMLR